MEEEKSQGVCEEVVEPSEDVSKLNNIVDKQIEPIESENLVKPNGDDGVEEALDNEKAVENHSENSLGSRGDDSQDNITNEQPSEEDNGIETNNQSESHSTNDAILNEENKSDDVSSQDNDNNDNDNSQPTNNGEDILEQELCNKREETSQATENNESQESQTFTQANEEIDASDNQDSEIFKDVLESQPEVSESQTFTQNEIEQESQDDNTDSQVKDNSADSESVSVNEEIKDESTANESITKDDDDNIANPTFENAPELVTEQSSEDHTEASDPFDELLKGDTDNVAVEKPDNPPVADVVSADNDNQDDDIQESNYPEDDATPDEPSQDVEVVGEPGEDEEVCLLPDTEREISEADRLKALEASKILKSEEITAESDKPSEAEEPPEDSERTEVDGETSAVDGGEELLEPSDGQPDVGLDDALPVDNIDKSSHEIQEISPFDNPCIQCSVDKPCCFKLNRDNTVQYICDSACVDKFIETSGIKYTVLNKSYVIAEILPRQHTCSECEELKTCHFYYKSDGEDTHYCSLACLHSMMADEQHKYTFKRKIININEIDRVDEPCAVCNSTSCHFTFTKYGEVNYLCSTECVKTLNETEGGRYKLKAKIPLKTPIVKVANMSLLKQPLLKLKVISNATDKYLDEGYKIQAKTPAAAAAAREDRERSFVRRCVQCNLTVTGEEKNLTWETMDFCNETCLQRYQNVIGANCANCKNVVNHTSLGKYCVRFGYDIRQFCCSTCLEDFKKGLKICCYCQRDISLRFDGFLAPVGDKGQFKDFCSKQCMAKFEQMSKNPIPQPVWAKCAVCSTEKPTQIEVEIDEDHSQRLCSDPCFAAFKFVNSIFPDQCRWCKKYFERKSERCFTIYDQQTPQCFCTKACMNVYISNSRHIVPCSWCKVKKYNFDMIRRTLASGQTIMMCSLNCLNLYQVSVNAISSRKIKCDMCKRTSQAQYHLTMSDATVRNFCTYQCVMSFQGQYAKPNPSLIMGDQTPESAKAVPTGAPRRTTNSTVKVNAQTKHQNQVRSSLPVISNVQSLASTPPSPKLAPQPKQTSQPKQTAQPSVHVTRGKSKRMLQTMPPPAPEPEPPRVATPPPPPKPLTPPPPPPPKIYNHVLVKTLPPVEVANKATMTKPMMVTKGVSCRPHPCTKECQTDSSLERRVLIPVPVPIYVPVPIAMYSLPFPMPIPIPIPIPTPVFIPTTRNSAKGILKEITKIHDKMPTDPFEAELLMMAEMVAGDKKKSESDSETDDENDEGFSPDAMDGGNAFGEDMLQMALKMASEYEEPAVDLESAMTASTITPSSHPGMPGLDGEAMHHHQMMVLEQQRAVAVLRASQPAPASRGKRPPPAAAPVTRASRSSKRRRQEPPPPPPAREPVEKPDANMCLKYTFGVNAWKQWVMTKNAEIEKSSVRRKPFKSEILQLTADELNYSLCLFVKEVRKPNGSEYAPDTIYYLVLGIQQYLFENGRIDNIFTDPYYEKFTECLDEVARKFSVLYNDSQYIVTRVEEEHLWESKQLGAHSPHVLLSTLMFFNTKHFNLVTVEEHMQLSFSHIMKHWKRSPNQPGGGKLPGSRNVLLRFYPPQSALEANSRKKKVYEQQENEDNPLRCPVKLYEFYISKCPESVRTRNDVFYLLPERSCVPDSPVWYSTQALGRDALAKMLHRVKMVKEINIALLTS